MKIIILVLMLSSCATSYKVKRCTVIDSIETCSTAQITSRRDFPQGVEVVYKEGTFIFKANQVQSTSSPLEQVGAQAVNTLLSEIIKNKE